MYSSKPSGEYTLPSNGNSLQFEIMFSAGRRKLQPDTETLQSQAQLLNIRPKNSIGGGVLQKHPLHTFSL